MEQIDRRTLSSLHAKWVGLGLASPPENVKRFELHKILPFSTGGINSSFSDVQGRVYMAILHFTSIPCFFLKSDHP